MSQLKQKFLANNAVATSKIVDENVTLPKLAPGMLDQASGLAMLDSSRKLSIDRIPQALIDQVTDHETRLNVLEGRQTLHELITLTQEEIDAKAFDLTNAPYTPGLTFVSPVAGNLCAQGIDYLLTGATISWTGLGLDEVGLVAGDKIQVWYDISSGGIVGDLQNEITARQNADAALQTSINNEVTNRTNADNALSSRITTIENQNLDSRLTTAESDIVAIENQVGNANGIASLDGAGKVPVSQLPNSIMQYKGLWNANTNTPALSDGIGNSDTAIGDVYRVSVAGTQDFGSGNISFEIGDYVILNDSKVWEKSDTTDSVLSVNGKQGVVSIDLADLPNVQTAIGDETTNRTNADGALDTRMTSAEGSIASLIAAFVPLGVIIPFAGSVAPSGWAFCDGAEKSKTTYSALYAVIGDTYATQFNEITGAVWASPAVGNFRLPDYRASFLRGVGIPLGLDSVTLGGRQAQKTAKNGLANAASSLSGATATLAGAHTHTVTGTCDIGHTHAASTVTGTTNIGHTHAASALSATFTGTAHSHTISYLAGTGGTISLATGGTPLWQPSGNSSGTGSTTAGGTVSGTAAGQTLGTTNVALASGSAAGQTLASSAVSLSSGAAASAGGHAHAVTGTADAQVITGDNETRPINKGVNYIIRLG